MVTSITQDLLTSKRNRPRTICNIRKGIIIHWTANTNKGANAKANRNYFNNTTTYASTHFLVDDKNIIQAIPLNEVAWSVGATSYRSIGKKMFHNGLQPNYTTVSIEMCVNQDSDYSKTEENTVWLTAYLLKKFNLTCNDIYLHYDITGKNCHAYYVKDRNAWKHFKDKVKDIYNDISTNSQLSIYETIDKQIELLELMNIRKGPDSTYNVIAVLSKKSILSVYESINGWYKVKTQDGHIGYMTSNPKYSKVIGYDIKDNDNTKNSPNLNITGATGKITATTLNIRKQPSTYSDIVSTYKINEVVNLLEEQGCWYRTNKGWIYSQYVERIDERFNATLTTNANIRDVNLKILCTGAVGDKILTSNKKQYINGIEVYACKYGKVRGYIQSESFKRI